MRALLASLIAADSASFLALARHPASLISIPELAALITALPMSRGLLAIQVALSVLSKGRFLIDGTQVAPTALIRLPADTLSGRLRTVGDVAFLFFIDHILRGDQVHSCVFAFFIFNRAGPIFRITTS